jgi:hypothetical protein
MFGLGNICIDRELGSGGVDSSIAVTDNKSQSKIYVHVSWYGSGQNGYIMRIKKSSTRLISFDAWTVSHMY